MALVGGKIQIRTIYHLQLKFLLSKKFWKKIIYHTQKEK